MIFPKNNKLIKKLKQTLYYPVFHFLCNQTSTEQCSVKLSADNIWMKGPNLKLNKIIVVTRWKLCIVKGTASGSFYVGLFDAFNYTWIDGRVDRVLAVLRPNSSGVNAACSVTILLPDINNVFCRFFLFYNKINLYYCIIAAVLT